MAVSHQKFEGYLGDLPFPFPGAASTPNSFWIENVEDIIIRIVPGLADGRFVSFLAFTNQQYYYWRNYKSEFRLDQPPPQEDVEGTRLFNADATFIWRPGYRESASSFVSFSHPDRIIRHRQF